MLAKISKDILFKIHGQVVRFDGDFDLHSQVSFVSFRWPTFVQNFVFSKVIVSG